jgi:RHS repeat-associated protein
VVGLTDPAGSQLVDTYSYDPTGNILSQTGTVPNNWQYAGGYFNQNTGLTKFGTRYYDPTLGRWTQQDPVGGSLGNPDSLNRYLYAKDNPVNFTDPSGKDAASCVGAILVIGISGLQVIGITVAFVLVLAAAVVDLGPFGAILAGIILAAGFLAVVYEVLYLYNLIASQCGLPPASLNS